MAQDASSSKGPLPPRAATITSLAELKRALQPGAVVTMTAYKRHPDSELIGVPRTVVRADAEKVGFDTVHADGSHAISYLHWPKGWPKDDEVEFTEDGFIAHGIAYRIDKTADEVTDSRTKTTVVTCPNGHENPEHQHFCGECGAAIVARPMAKSPTPATGHPNGSESKSVKRPGELEVTEALTLAEEPEAEDAGAESLLRRPMRRSETARHVIERDKLGPLTKIGQGGQGVVYQAPNVKTKFAASMVYGARSRRQHGACAGTGFPSADSLGRDRSGLITHRT